VKANAADPVVAGIGDVDHPRRTLGDVARVVQRRLGRRPAVAREPGLAGAGEHSLGAVASDAHDRVALGGDDRAVVAHLVAAAYVEPLGPSA
jgi:hypothetical protein